MENLKLSLFLITKRNKLLINRIEQSIVKIQQRTELLQDSSTKEKLHKQLDALESWKNYIEADIENDMFSKCNEDLLKLELKLYKILDRRKRLDDALYEIIN